MRLKEDQQRLKDLLTDTITMLCKNSVVYKQQFSIEALIGITLDQEDIVLVNIKEIVRAATSQITNEDLIPVSEPHKHLHRKRKKRRSKHKNKRNKKENMGEGDLSDYSVSNSDENENFDDDYEPSNKSSRNSPSLDTELSTGLETESFIVKKETISDDEVMFIKDEPKSPTHCSTSDFSQVQVSQQVHSAQSLQSSLRINPEDDSPKGPNMRQNISYQTVKGVQSQQYEKGNNEESWKQYMDKNSLKADAKYRCAECGFRTKFRNSLVRHKRTMHAGEKQKIYPCKLCDKQFNTIFKRDDHMLAADHPKYIECPECGHKCTSKKNYRVHKLHHQPEKGYKCHLCDKTFISNVILQGHINTHTQQATFHCFKCKKSFRHYSTLSRHQRTCVKNLMVQCMQCHKTYTTSDSLIDHVKAVHEGALRYECRKCSRGYVNRQSRLRHEKKCKVTPGVLEPSRTNGVSPSHSDVS